MTPPAPTSGAREKLLTRPFLLLVFSHFAQALAYASMLLLPLYVEHLGANRSQIGTIMAAAAVGGLLFRPAAGWALDHVGRRPTLLVGTVVLFVGMSLIAFVDRLGPLVYVARFIIGMGVGTLFTGYFTWAADLVPESRRTEGLALFGVSGLLPLAIGPVVQQFGVATPDLRWLFPIVGAAILVSSLTLFFIHEPERHRAPADDDVSAAQALTQPGLRPVWLATVVFAGLVSVFFAFATVTAANRGIADSAAVWFTYAAGAIGVRLLGARLPDRIGPTNLVAPALACYGGAYLLAAGAWSVQAFMVAGLLAGLGHGYCFPVLTSQVVTRAPDRLRGGALATFTFTWELSGLVLTPLFGWIADVTDDATMLTTATLFGMVGLSAWAVWEHRVAGLRPQRATGGGGG